MLYLRRPQGRFYFGNVILNTMSRFIDYLKDTKEEISHVSWPTQRQAAVYTALVVGISAAVAVFLATFDFLFSQALDWFIK